MTELNKQKKKLSKICYYCKYMTNKNEDASTISESCMGICRLTDSLNLTQGTSSCKHFRERYL